MDLSDLDGRSLLRKYDPSITGSPFITDDWVAGRVTLSNGKQVSALQVKLNIESNELYYLDSAGREMIVKEGTIKRVEFKDAHSKDSVNYIFKTGYPSIDKQDENFYYQVFTEGRIELVAKKFKYIRDEKNDLTGEMSRQFVDGITVLYVDAYGIMQPFHSSKDFVSSLVEQDKEPAMKAFLDANKINVKRLPDLIKLFNFYNSLH